MPQFLPDAFHPKLGLASIETWNDPQVPLLPEDSRLQPIDASVEAKMEEILHAKTFERVILDAFRPQVGDRSILRPGPFYAMREQVLARIEQAQAEQTDPVAAEEFRAAAALLIRQGQVHELGEQYRYALLKG